MAIALISPNSSIPATAIAEDSSAAAADGRSPAAVLAPGFRFHPTDEELVSYYLKRKLLRRPFRFDAIAEVDLYKWEPGDLPGLARLRSRDQEWYFFCPVDRRHSSRSRINRVTPAGYWKTTGKDRPIVRRLSPGSAIAGMKKTLVFHSGRAPRGQRTNWVMHEYRLEDEELARSGIAQDTHVLCRIFQKGGAGPQNGAHYGAPYVEDEWEEGDELLPGRVGEEVGVIGAEDQHGLQNQDLGFQHETAPVLVRSDDQNVDSHPEEPPIFREGFLVHEGSFNGLGDYFATSKLQDGSKLCNDKGETNSVAEQSQPLAQPPNQVNELMQVKDFAGTVIVKHLSINQSTFDGEGAYVGIPKLQDDPNLHSCFGETTAIAEQSQPLTKHPFQINEFVQANDFAGLGNVNLPSIDQGSFEIQGKYDGIELQDNPNLSINMEETTAVAKQSQPPTKPPSQVSLFAQVNVIADTLNVNQPSTKGYATCPVSTCDNHKSDKAVDGNSNLQEMYDGMDFLDTMDGYTLGEVFDLQEPNQMLLADHNDTNIHQNSLLSCKPSDFTGGWVAGNYPVFVDSPSSNLLLRNSGQIDMLDPSMSESYGSKILDDIMEYYDADSILHDAGLDSFKELETVNFFTTNDSSLPPERWDSNSATWETPHQDLGANAGNEMRAADASTVDEQSSGKNEDIIVATDVQENDAQYRPFTKRLVNMLSSFSPPPAFAAEFPPSALKAVGENVKNYSTHPINVTAEMIQISGLTVRDNAKFWSLQQKGDKEYLLSYGTKAINLTKSGSYKTATKMHDRVVSAALRGALYLFFLFALFLTASFKLGICICTR